MLSSATKKQSMEFLQKGTAKSRETLKTIGSTKFYGSKSQTPDKLSGSFSSYSSSVKKRTPGLMPDPTPTKLPRLSDVKYSWSKNKTTLVSNTKSPGSLQGFSNLGNTCYMNAILQSLFALKPLTHDLLRNNKQIFSTLTKESLYYNLAKLLCVRKKTNVAESVKLELLRNVKTAISSTAKRFSGNQQHDAHEFLGQVLDQLKEEVLKITKETPGKCSTDTEGELAAPTRQEDYVNPTIQNFEFEVNHTIQCTKCGLKVTKAEQFNDLSVDLPRHRDLEDPQTIQDALDVFLGAEMLEYTCAECGCKQSQVFHEFARLPRVLVVHLKRYGYSVSKSENKKIGQSIFIPRYITLQSFCSNSTQPPSSPFTVVSNSPSVVSTEVMSDEHIQVRRKIMNVRKRNLFTGTFRHTKSPEPLEFEEDTWVSLEKKPKQSPFIEALDDIDVKVPDDEELKQYIDLREDEETAENKTQAPSNEDELPDLTEDQQLKKALELSRLEAQQNSTIDMSDLQLENMTEDEMLSLAMERSMSESTNQKHPLINLVDEPSSNENNGHVNQSVVMKNCSSKLFNSVPSKRKQISSRLEKLNHTVSKSSQRSLDLDNLSPICTKTYSKSKPCIKPTLKGGAMDWESVVGKSKPGIFSSDDEVTFVTNDCDFKKADQKLDKKSDCHQDVQKLDKRSEHGLGQKSDENIGRQFDMKLNTKSDSNSEVLKSNRKLAEKSDNSSFKKSEEKLDRKSENGFDIQKNEDKLVVKLDAFPDDFDEVDGGRLLEIYKKVPDPPCEDDFLRCQEKDLEDKENRTPPHSAENLNTDSDWTTPTRNHGSEESHDVFAFTLDEEDEDIRKAKELSLQELETEYNSSGETTTYQQPSPVIRSKEENKDLKKHFEDGHLPSAYRLVSVVSHIGSTSSAGHYISDVYDFKKDSWFSYNDSHITETTEAEIRQRRERSGYIFFYMSRDIHEDCN